LLLIACMSRVSPSVESGLFFPLFYLTLILCYYSKYIITSLIFVIILDIIHLYVLIKVF